MDAISTLNCSMMSDLQITTLRDSGIATLLDFVRAPKDLVISVLGIGNEDYSKCRREILNRIQTYPVSLKQMEEHLMSTGIKSLDILLRGGLQSGDMIQIYGKTGSGKTQLSLYLTSQVCRSNRSTVVYFDMKNDFYAGRLHQLCGGDNDCLENVTVFKPPNLENFLLILDDIKQEFIAGVNGLYSRCRLIVVDSVPMVIYPAVNKEDNYSWRFHQEKLIGKLQWLADNIKLSVILVNHSVVLRAPVTRSLIVEKPGSCKAALGRYWQHRIPIRIQLSKIEKSSTGQQTFDYYSASLEKFNRGPCGNSFNFCIKDNNIESIS